MNTPIQTLMAVVPVVTAPVCDDETTKAVVRHELGSLDDFNLPSPVLTRVQARAERSLHAAIRAEYDHGVTVPCLTDPATWDADPRVGAVTHEDVFRAARLCRTACPVFAQCAAFLATEPPVCGVIAGRFVRDASEVRPSCTTNRKDDWATTAPPHMTVRPEAA